MVILLQSAADNETYTPSFGEGEETIPAEVLLALVGLVIVMVIIGTVIEHWGERK